MKNQSLVEIYLLAVSLIVAAIILAPNDNVSVQTDTCGGIFSKWRRIF